ncbi:MAG: PleD family two-component system response regulator [Nitrospiria bacterium]
MKVLIVDDSRPIRNIMSRMLVDMGHEIIEAANGEEALGQLETHPDIELVMLDWNMPKMNGIETLMALKKNKDRTSKPTVVMVSTENETKKIVRAMCNGASEYIMKPFTKEILVEKLEILGIKENDHA